MLQDLNNDMGHFGGRGRNCFYWHFTKIDIKVYVTRKCPFIKQKKPTTHTRGPMGTITTGASLVSTVITRSKQRGLF